MANTLGDLLDRVAETLGEQWALSEYDPALPLHPETAADYPWDRRIVSVVPVNAQNAWVQAFEVKLIVASRQKDGKKFTNLNFVHPYVHVRQVVDGQPTDIRRCVNVVVHYKTYSPGTERTVPVGDDWLGDNTNYEGQEYRFVTNAVTYITTAFTNWSAEMASATKELNGMVRNARVMANACAAMGVEVDNLRLGTSFAKNGNAITGKVTNPALTAKFQVTLTFTPAQMDKIGTPLLKLLFGSGDTKTVAKLVSKIGKDKGDKAEAASA